EKKLELLADQTSEPDKRVESQPQPPPVIKDPVIKDPAKERPPKNDPPVADPPGQPINKKEPTEVKPPPLSNEEVVVKQFKELLTAAQQRKQLVITRPNPELDITNHWSKTECRVKTVSFDVKKTNSVISPFTAHVTIEIDQLVLGNKTGRSDFTTEETARAADHLVEINPEKNVYHFSWQEGEWVYKHTVIDGVSYNDQNEMIVEKRSIKEPLWPFTTLKKPGEVGRFDRSIVIRDGVQPSTEYAIADLTGRGAGPSPVPREFTSPSGKVLLQQNKNVVTAFDTGTKKELFAERGKIATSSGFSPSGKFYAAIAEIKNKTDRLNQKKSETVSIYQTEPWTELSTQNGFHGYDTIQFSSDEQFLFVGEESMIHLSTGKRSGNCNEFAFENYEKYTAAQKILPLKFSVTEFKKFVWGSSAKQLIISPNAQHFLQTVYKKITIFNSNTRKPITLPIAPSRPLLGARFLQDGKTLRLLLGTTQRPDSEDDFSGGAGMGEDGRTDEEMMRMNWVPQESWLIDTHTGKTISRSYGTSRVQGRANRGTYGGIPLGSSVLDFDINTGNRIENKFSPPSEEFQLSPSLEYAIIPLEARGEWELQEITTGKKTNFRTGTFSQTAPSPVFKFSLDEAWMAVEVGSQTLGLGNDSEEILIFSTSPFTKIIAIRNASGAEFKEDGKAVSIIENTSVNAYTGSIFELPSGKFLSKEKRKPAAENVFSPDGRFFKLEKWTE
ncbi:MAG: hypothetical protein P8M80_18075, partial [Pirellulaceae bacterium]|nr:hypothetical protein [Pirellulaceae bacterium]